MGLGDIYGKGGNPYDRKARTLGAVMDSSGYAKPLIAAALGKTMKQGEEYDQAQAGKRAAQGVLEQVFKIAKHDPELATQIMREESKRTPGLERFKDLEFNAPIKDNWGTVTSNGQAYQVYLPGLAAMAQNPEDKELRAKTIVPIGKPKKAAPPKTRTVQRGGKNVTEEWDPEAGTWKEIGRGPKWNPESGKDGAGGEDPKEFRQHTGQLDSLKTSLSAAIRGTGEYQNVTPEEREAARDTIKEQIRRKERYLKLTFPEQWKKYVPPEHPTSDNEATPAERGGPPQPTKEQALEELRRRGKLK